VYSRVNYTLIGAFTILLTIGIIIFVLWLGNSSFKDDTTTYMLRMRESVSGLSKDSGVKLKGVNIGTVKEIRVNPQNIEEIEILLDIKKSIPIKDDMRGVVTMFGLTGLSYIEIQGGTNSAKTLHSIDGKPPIIKSATSMLGDLQEKFENFSNRLDTIADRSQELLSEENLQNFSDLLRNANQVAINGVSLEKKIAKTLDETTMAIKEFRSSFEELSTSYNTLASDLDREIKPFVDSIDKSAKSVESLSVSLEKSINRGDYNMQKILQPSMNDINNLTIELKSLTRELRESPSNLIYRSRESRRGPGE